MAKNPMAFASEGNSGTRVDSTARVDAASCAALSALLIFLPAACYALLHVCSFCSPAWVWARYGSRCGAVFVYDLRHVPSMQCSASKCLESDFFLQCSQR